MISFDFNDSKALWEFSKETVVLAEKYQETRINYSTALKTLKLALAQAYSDGKIKETISEDKAYLKLAEENEGNKQALSDVIECEQHYKGLEKVLDARLALASLNQSFIKNKVIVGE